jgi:anti-sigma factor RsiW
MSEDVGRPARRRHRVPKPRCTDLVSLLADFVEHNLPLDVHAQLEQHLAKCPRCVAQLKTYQSTVSLLRSIREDDLPAELRCTLKAFVDRNCQN